MSEAILADAGRGLARPAAREETGPADGRGTAMSKRRSRMRTTLVGLVLVVALAGCDWAQVGFGPEATSFNPYEPALTPASVGNLSERWSTACACNVNRPLVAGGTVYAIDGTGGVAPYTLTLRAFAAADGRPRWSTPLGQTTGEGVLAALANGLVYVVVRPTTASDQLVAIDTTSGTVRWRRTPPTPGSGHVRVDAPVVDGALVFVTATASDASTLSAFDATGRRVWTVAPGGLVFEAAKGAAVAGQTVYVSTYFAQTSVPLILLRGYSVTDGAARSTVTIPAGLPVESLAVANGLVYGTYYTSFGRLGSTGTFAIDPDTGAIPWTGELLTLAVTPGAVLSNNPRTGELVAHHPITGAPVWTATQTDFRAAAAGELVFFSEGDIRRLSDGGLVGRVQTDAGDPLRLATPANGQIFATSPSHLYALAP
jgi:outer membrane protein assembly factor BamB